MNNEFSELFLTNKNSGNCNCTSAGRFCQEPAEKETATVEPAKKKLKLQRTILVDGFQLEKQFRLPTQAVPFGIVYPAKETLPINNPFEDHIVAHEPYDHNWQRSLPVPFKGLGSFLDTVPPTTLSYFRRVNPPQNQKLCDILSILLGDLKGVPNSSRPIHFEPCSRAKLQNTLFTREPLFIKQVTHKTAHLKERYLRYMYPCKRRTSPAKNLSQKKHTTVVKDRGSSSTRCPTSPDVPAVANQVMLPVGNLHRLLVLFLLTGKTLRW